MIQVFTPNEFQNYLLQLPKKFRDAQGEIQKEMAMNLADRIRRRAPIGSTGSLHKDIKAKLSKSGWSVVGPRHWSYVNAGIAPDKLIPIELFEAHMGSPGSTAGRHANISNPKAWVFAGFHEGEGFVDRALTSFENNIPKTIERGMIKALSK